MTNLSQGSIVYGDASEIVTELASASDGDQLELSSGLPAWVTPTPASAVWTELANVKLTANGNLVSGTFAVHDYLYVIVYGGLVTPDGQSLKVNGHAGYNTNYAWSDVRNGSWSQNTSYACWQYGFGASSNLMSTNFWIQNGTAHDRTVNKLCNWNRAEQTGTASSDALNSDLGVGMVVDTNAITSIQVCNSAGVTASMLAGSQLIVLGVS
jgi:hypothetical protein